MVTGAPLAATLVQTAELMRRPFWSVECAVYFQDDDGEDQVVHTGLAAELLMPERSADETPWSNARHAGRSVILAGTDQLPESLQAAAEAAGFQSCWCEPIVDPMHELPACFVTWPPRDVSPALGQGQALERTTRLISLALQQRDQPVRLVRAARQDRLTGLANRTRFVAALDDTLLDPGQVTVALVLYIDLDDFKPINDRFGHAFGDRVRVTTAKRLTVIADDRDLVARIGGDEFAILTTWFESEAPALRYADDVIAAIAVPIEVGTETVHVGASIGLAGASGTRSTSSQVLDAADQAMYQAKREGRNRSRHAAS